MQFWQALAFTDTDQLLDLARAAEEMGFDGVLVSDHLFHPEKLASRYPYAPDGAPPFGPGVEFPEPFTAIAAMAAVTRRLRFATGIFNLPLRHPIAVAKSVATAARLSRDRVVLGIGSGWMKEEFDQFGVDFGSRGARCDEAMTVVRALLAGGMTEHHGRFFDFDRLEIAPVPRQPVPIWVGGTSAPALRRAGRLGDGWIGSGHALADVPALMHTLARHRREAGREGVPFDVVVPLVEPLTGETCRRLAEAGVTATVSWPPAYVLGRPGDVAEMRGVLERFAESVIRPPRS